MTIGKMLYGLAVAGIVLACINPNSIGLLLSVVCLFLGASLWTASEEKK